jgi:hypothetical protein
MRNTALIEQREIATGRVVRAFAVLVAGLAVFFVNTRWAIWDTPQWWALFALSMAAIGYGVLGVIMWTPMARQDIEPDEMFSRTYSEAEPPPGLKIVQVDGRTLRMTDLGLSRDEADLAARRLERARWYWSRHILAGKGSETNITNLSARYGDMLAEMQRVGALENEGGRLRVTPWARESFVEASPSLMNDRQN